MDIRKVGFRAWIFPEVCAAHLLCKENVQVRQAKRGRREGLRGNEIRSGWGRDNGLAEEAEEGGAAAGHGGVEGVPAGT